MTIYLDVDGVLANFHDEACRVHGWDPNDPKVQCWNFYEPAKLTQEQFWAPLDNGQFWASVPEYPWADYLVSSLRELGQDIVFCTVPSKSATAYSAKLAWLRSKPWYQGEEIILLSGHKERLANKDSLLLDDNVDNVKAFAAAGGLSVLFPQTWNEGGKNGVFSVRDVVHSVALACQAESTLLQTYEKQHRASEQAKAFIERATTMYQEAKTASGEVRVTDPTTGGQKGQKLARFDLVPAYPLWELAELYGRGARKYADRNWEKGYRWSLSFGAMLRHIWQFWMGEERDSETGAHHLASAAFHCFALIEFGKTHPELDDRPKGSDACQK